MSVALITEGLLRSLTKRWRAQTGERQDTEIYFDPEFAELLETWANDSCWPEIRHLLSDRKGKVLDLACGTGRAYDFLRDIDGLEYYGCDISQPLIERAATRGIPRDRLQVADATKLQYADNTFDAVFSIGSLEHFSASGLTATISECRRVCRGLNLHLVPISQSGFNEGWITPYQSYWNNSEKWWKMQFGRPFGNNVRSIKSRWSDRRSRGVWFIGGE